MYFSFVRILSITLALQLVLLPEGILQFYLHMRSHGINQCSFLVYPFNLRTWVTVTFRNSLLVATLSAKYALLSYFRPSGYDFYCVCDAFFKTEMWFAETPPTSKNEKNRIKRNFSFFAFWAIISLICKTENPVASFSYPSAFPTVFFNPLQILQQEDFSSPS